MKDHPKIRLFNVINGIIFILISIIMLIPIVAEAVWSGWI